MRRAISLAASLLGFLALGGGVASAAPPQIVSTSVVQGTVTATSVTLAGSINPGGQPTTYRFEYLTQAAYDANLEAEPPRGSFAGAAFAPIGGAGTLGTGISAVPVSQHIAGLASSTPYRYRLEAIDSKGEAALSISRPFATEAPTNAFALLDNRGWEIVSPIDKAGGAIQVPGSIFGGGVFQADAGGESFTYSSADSFGPGAQGAPAGSQYLATRTAGGWSSTNVTVGLLSGSYGSEPDGVPYQLYSASLSLGLLSNGERCRGIAGGECPVANPPLTGSGAPSGFRDYYRRTALGAFESLLSAADLLTTSLGPRQFELRLVAATPDLSHLVLSTCAALTTDATEVAAAGGCDPAAQNLYEWTGGSLSLINILPGDSSGTPGAMIASRLDAVTSSGPRRVYWSEAGRLYLREGSSTQPVDAAQGGGGEFQAASASGAIAYFTDGGDLYRFSALAGTSEQVTTSGEVEGVLGASEDGSRAYYATAGAVFLAEGGTTAPVANGPVLPSDLLGNEGTARVSADGSSLLFLSTAELTGYPDEGRVEAFLYGPPLGAHAALLTCVSCNPSGERPRGAASIPGTRANGTGVDATDIYAPRVLSADGERVFFETTDQLSPQDTDGAVADVYEWEAGGEGTCMRAGGCVQLISGGRGALPSYFLDADADGGEVFFLTADSLYPLDPGSYDVYVAREFGGLPVPESPIPCIADACQALPEAPEDPTPGTLTPNAGNPALKVSGGSGTSAGPRKKKKHRRHRGKKSKGSAKGRGPRK